MPNDAKEAQKTILVVDDEESIRKFVSSLLKKNGYNVLVAESGEDALQQSRAYQGKIDLLMSNIQMPGMTGMELGTKMILERPDLRVMLMSGFTSGMLVLNDGWHFLHKPFIPSQLKDLIMNLLSPSVPEDTPANSNEHTPRASDGSRVIDGHG